MNNATTVLDGSMRTYLREIRGANLISREQSSELTERIARGNPEARDRLVRSNLRLVETLARRYLVRGVALEDLVAVGNLGLMRAAEGFDGTSGVRFSAYASFWIKKALRAAIQKYGRPARTPAHIHKLLAKWHRATDMLSDRLGRLPTASEVGCELNLFRRQFKIALQALRTAGTNFGGFDDCGCPGLGDAREPLAALAC